MTTQQICSTNILARGLLLLLAICWAGHSARAKDHFTIKCSSPDGRFALRFSNPTGPNSSSYKVDLIEKASGEVVMDLVNAFEDHLDDTILVWSADSRRVAFSTRGTKTGETTVYFWNGSVFEEATLPDKLPSPHIDFGYGAGAVKNYGGAVKALRWLKSGELEIARNLTMQSRVDDQYYTGIVVFTLGFDARHRASIRKVGKTKTTVDD